MKSDVQVMAGGDPGLAPDGPSNLKRQSFWLALALLLSVGSICSAQELYKYRGDDGEWIYSDRPPADGSIVERRDLEKGEQESALTVTHGFEGRTVALTAHNQYYVAVELGLKILDIRGLRYPHPDEDLRWVVPARSDTSLIALDLLEDGSTPLLEYQFQYLAGDPDARHQPDESYRAPFAISTNYPITQAFPQVATHTTPDSYYAVDMAMPIGTDIFAARGGIVFDVAASNFRGGLDAERDGPAANVIRIMHDDGTYAIYAHLNTNTIRVRPGERVERGEYIADSGNTGFSSGPHLHFSVVRNAGMKIESVPVTFKGANESNVVPAAGAALTAY